MAAGYQELFMEQGTSFNTSISLYDVNGLSYNLLNYTANSQIRKSYYSSNVTATFDASVGDDTGNIILTLGANLTSNISPGRYLYDVIIRSKTNPDTDTIRVLEGIVNVIPSITKV